MERIDRGLVKWGVLAGTIIALEIIGEESLTSACQRGLDTKLGKLAIPAIAVVTVAHLHDFIPHQYDPYYGVARTVDKLNQKVGTKWVQQHGQGTDSVV